MTEAALRAPVWLRLRVYLTRARLNRQIAAGCPCESTAALALRARQLTHRRTRQRVARSLRAIVEYVAYSERVRGRPPFSAVVIDRAAVRDGREAMLGLAERLDDAGLVSPQGVALAQALLSDGVSSPLSNPRCGRTVIEAVWEVADALDADPPTPRFVGVIYYRPGA
jgi:hypothetical protein